MAAAAPAHGRVDEKRGVVVGGALQPPRGYWSSKSGTQIGIIAFLAIGLLVGLAALASVPRSVDEQTGWERFKALIVDPDTHHLAATSGAMFCAMALVVGIGLWALLDNKEGRFAAWVQKLFANKSEDQTCILVYSAIVLTVALPFILLAAQGCQPFQERGEKFRDFLFGKSVNWYTTGGAIMTLLCLGVLAPSAILYSLFNDQKSAGQFLENKSFGQKFSVLAITSLALTWGLIFSMLAVKGVAPFDQGWENFKHLLCDNTSQVKEALPAVGIVTGLGIVAGLEIWGLTCTKESEILAKITPWWQARTNGQKAIIIATCLLFIAAIPLITLQVKGVGVNQAIVGDMNPLLEGGIIAATGVALLALAFLCPHLSMESLFGNVKAAPVLTAVAIPEEVNIFY